MSNRFLKMYRIVIDFFTILTFLTIYDSKFIFLIFN